MQLALTEPYSTGRDHKADNSTIATRAGNEKMVRTHPYAPMHALSHHPLAAWLKLYQTDAVAAMAEALAECEQFEIQPQSNDFETKVAVHAMRAAQKGDLKISDGPNYIKETTKFIETFDQWIKCGQKIYEFGYELTHELVRTEIQQVAGIDLNTPMPSFYLTFDMDPPYILPDGLILDGILVLISESKSASSTKNRPYIHVTTWKIRNCQTDDLCIDYHVK